ncbi:helix-turn-helix domain-containing protein [Companilactobacillus bobalius]|uniref:Repressor LexA n=3 Tax=Companilactobacillus bobalius TaxID=2801451 RepID=A0A202F884_9LACO|nr:helix-turn-helix transcriptional regulator [Companilactobacillus bobalius]GEO58968.1 hypothetical protein LBO01_20970 [Companilactobacillus paralimentarius]KAE9559509.1 hypothetical protein ATN92_11570 [Companilactobacillus bobalius]KAE9563951.1 hypothetical protein ATN92_01915 [Companilactobacillus bobalius]KRK83620.1 hypothetical protein FC78_GL001577 [Companilactobacillus bobalius DSM 19674]OVE96704.1 Repressor LexA [Companilactobacillus bobalius]
MGMSEKLKYQRKKNGLSQGDVAKKLNITRQAISQWERGESRPDLENLHLISGIYHVDLSYFFD